MNPGVLLFTCPFIDTEIHLQCQNLPIYSQLIFWERFSTSICYMLYDKNKHHPNQDRFKETLFLINMEEDAFQYDCESKIVTHPRFIQRIYIFNIRERYIWEAHHPSQDWFWGALFIINLGMLFNAILRIEPPLTFSISIS